MVTAEIVGDILCNKSTAPQLLNPPNYVKSEAAETEQQSPEDLIFELFKVPDKEEACIGKLISVGPCHSNSNVHRFNFFYLQNLCNH